MTPTPQQLAILEALSSPTSLGINALAGTGKCLGKDTPVLLASGAVKPVQEIKPGDYLAGPREPRLVLSISTGYGELVRIVPTKGDSWVCNTDHILTLTGSNRATGQTIDMSVKEYLSRLRLPGFNKTWKLFRTPIAYWSEAKLPIDPYIFGLWVGDGHTGEPMFTNQDQVVLSAIERWAISQNYTYTEWAAHSSFPGEKYQEHCKTIRIGANGESHPMRQYLRSFTGKQIPSIYKTSNIQQRLELLAGIVDSDGSLDTTSLTGYEVTFRDYWLAEDLCFIARSLGFAAYTKVRKIAGGTYHRTYISGDVDRIPVRIEHKQARPRMQVKRVTVTGFTIEPIGEGDYYGFTLDGDGRFLLGDFTVTHNTSTLRLTSHEISRGGLATSISKSTVKDLSEALSPSWECKGLHALGLRAIRAFLGYSPKVDTGNDALYAFCKSALEDEKDSWLLLQSILQLAKAAQGAGVMPNYSRSLLPDTFETWELIADHFDIDFSQQIHSLARSGLIHINDLARKTGNINFTHMLSLPLAWKLPITQYKQIIIDEAQDLNPLQHALLLRLLRKGGRVIMAGDPNQAIFAFAGALPNSYTELRDKVSAVEKPLTVSWRCSKAVIREAQKMVPEIEHAPNAPEGDVIWHGELTLSDLPSTIICPHTTPLISLATKALAENIRAEVVGRNIGSGLTSLTKRLASGKASNSMSIPQFLDRLHRWSEREQERKPKQRIRIRDKVTALEILSQPHPNLGALRNHITQLFVDHSPSNPPDLLLSTVHKAKGLEWDDVLILDQHLFGKYAKKDWEIEQARNLRYVATTRARQTIQYVRSEHIY